MTTSRYSLGTTSDDEPATFISLKQRGHVALKRLLTRDVERGKRLVRRAVIVAEHLHKMRGER